MNIRIFTIPTQNPDKSTSDLNALLSSHRVVHVDRQFVADGANSFWSICVTSVDGDSPRPPERSEKVDYREVLPEAEFAVFAKLRALRKEIAEKEGVPAYALFTNEQLAEMVRQSVTSATMLRKIKGVGQSRVDKYGEPFLQILSETFRKPADNLFEQTSENKSHAR